MWWLCVSMALVRPSLLATVCRVVLGLRCHQHAQRLSHRAQAPSYELYPRRSRTRTPLTKLRILFLCSSFAIVLFGARAVTAEIRQVTYTLLP